MAGQAAQAIEEAVAALTGGGVVVYPTETVYGMGVDAVSEAAIDRLVALKGRAAGKGLSLLVSGMEMAAGLVAGEPPAAARALADAFWPGPLTIVVPAAQPVCGALVGPGGGVGLRCSADPVAAALVQAYGAPLTSTSANPSAEPPARSAAEARAYFGRGVDCYLDDGPRRAAEVSTVVEFLDGRAILRRVGALAVDTLSAVTQIERLEV